MPNLTHPPYDSELFGYSKQSKLTGINGQTAKVPSWYDLYPEVGIATAIVS